MRSSTVVATSVTDHVFYVIVDVSAELILLTAFTSFPVVAVVLDPIAKGVSRGGDEERCLFCRILIFVKVSVTNGAVIVRLHTCYQFICSVCGGDRIDLSAIVVRSKLADFCTANGAGRFGDTGCFTVIVSFQLAGLCAANGAGCFLCAGCLAVIVGFQLAGLCTANGTGCFFCAGCFTVIVPISLTVSGVTSGANCLFSAGCTAACAIVGFGMLVIV